MDSRLGGEAKSQSTNISDAFNRAGQRVDTFWQRLTEGLELQALWLQFRAEARSSYSLYSREVDWEALQQETGARRFLKIASSLFWAMLMKLSPPRRVFLLIALVLGATTLMGFRLFGWPRELQYVVSGGALLFLLARELADRVTMKRDLEIAREIQHWLVPDAAPKIPGIEIAFTSRPANTVGGDYYDAFPIGPNSNPLSSNRLMLVVADVAGKSVPAALLMATFQASLRSLALTPTSLTELVSGLNRYSCAHSLGGRRFTTAFFAELNPVTRSLVYIRAGHNAPILRRASGSFDRLEIGDLPLGIDPNERFTCGTATLGPGDLLLIFTDGLIEAVNQNDQEFGEARVFDVLKVLRGADAEGTMKRLIATVDAFAAQARQHDDITCLVLRTI
jgi:phosphoserine phosphatase RsbU/P